jgi:hypothetical protein
VYGHGGRRVTGKDWAHLLTGAVLALIALVIILSLL